VQEMQKQTIMSACWRIIVMLNTSSSHSHF